MAKKRVVFVLPSLGKGGAQRATVSLINYLSENDKLDIALIALKNDEVEFAVHSSVRVIKLNSLSFKASLRKLIAVLKTERPHIVYSALWHINLLVCLSRFWLRFTSIHRFFHIASIHNNPTRIIQTENKVLSVLYYYFFARFSHSIVAVSEGIRRHLVSKCLIPSKKIVLAYNPAITDKHRAQLNEPLGAEFAIQNSGEYLIWVGRLDYQKDPLKFLELAKITSRPAIIVGDGPLEKDVKDFISANKLNEKVLHLPFQENVMSLIANAYLLIMTSRFEGFGLVLVEALAAGTPVISTNCSYGPSEIICDGKNGILLNDGASADEFAVAIDSIGQNQKLYLSMRAEASESVEKFSDRAVFQQYRELFF
ncbi:glycosyltransferase [Spongiibacter sp. KMU-166]|uniref:Glycosyltransferase n=1 Tax=Spongiibacter thalassae TaxID=2721624 RepID=A0ABX1GJZ1_9GAMM|nr:glycosyltransferase [Spongiibacter thalassae]NKI19559.1 glycosyltransferase [Spongiibacter thalassae]